MDRLFFLSFFAAIFATVASRIVVAPEQTGLTSTISVPMEDYSVSGVIVGVSSSQYDLNQNWIWNLDFSNCSDVPNITLAFNSFDIEADRDYLKVYRGGSEIISYTGGPSIPLARTVTFNGASRVIQFRWTTDYAVIRTGFSLTINYNIPSNLLKSPPIVSAPAHNGTVSTVTVPLNDYAVSGIRLGVSSDQYARNQNWVWNFDFSNRSDISHVYLVFDGYFISEPLDFLTVYQGGSQILQYTGVQLISPVSIGVFTGSPQSRVIQIRWTTSSTRLTNGFALTLHLNIAHPLRKIVAAPGQSRFTAGQADPYYSSANVPLNDYAVTKISVAVTRLQYFDSMTWVWYFDFSNRPDVAAITLVFDSFSSDGDRDFLRVIQGGSQILSYTGYYNPRPSPATICFNGTSRFVELRWTTDYAFSSYDGFAFNVQLTLTTPPNLSPAPSALPAGVVLAPVQSGKRSTVNVPLDDYSVYGLKLNVSSSNYVDNQDWTWNLDLSSRPDVTNITLEFDFLSSEPSFDFLKVYHGGAEILSYTGTSIPSQAPIISLYGRSRFIQLRWTTDAINRWNGFSLILKLIPLAPLPTPTSSQVASPTASPLPPGVLVAGAHSGLSSTVNVPINDFSVNAVRFGVSRSQYANNQMWYWNFDISNRLDVPSITIVFDSFQSEAFQDVLDVLVGGNVYVSFTGRTYSNTFTIPITGSSRVIVFRWRTNPTNRDYEGFSLTVQFDIGAASSSLFMPVSTSAYESADSSPTPAIVSSAFISSHVPTSVSPSALSPTSAATSPTPMPPLAPACTISEDYSLTKTINVPVNALEIYNFGVSSCECKNNMVWNWNFDFTNRPELSRVALMLSNFSSEATYDTLTFRNGTGIIQTFSGRRSPTTFLIEMSTGSRVISVNWITDVSVTANGFSCALVVKTFPQPILPTSFSLLEPISRSISLLGPISRSTAFLSRQSVTFVESASPIVSSNSPNATSTPVAKSDNIKSDSFSVIATTLTLLFPMIISLL